MTQLEKRMIIPRLALIAALIVAVAIRSNVPARGEPPVIRVSADGKGDYGKIQDAVDSAPEGAVVRIGNGTWTEAVTITKPLTLEGAGWEVSRIVSEKQASPELVEGLQRISRELDAETLAKLHQAFLKVYGSSPVLIVKNTKQVVIRNISFRGPRAVRKGRPTSAAAIDILDASVEIENCAVVESPDIGLAVKGDSHLKVKKCLVANASGTGVKVAVSENGSFEIVDSDIRNNQYSGLSIKSPSESISVKRCRVHGTGWHGIRYDGCSPTIESNVFYNTAVSGIYASGRTSAVVKNNLFYRSGISCWFQNADTIESNTFIGDRNAEEKCGITQGLQVLGASQPTIRRNIFVSCNNAVSLADIGSKSPFSKSTGETKLIENVFWKNTRNLALTNVGAQAERELPLPKGNDEQRPMFIDAEKRNFELDEESPLVNASIGARHLISLESSWPLQSEEDRSIRAVAERLKQTTGQR